MRRPFIYWKSGPHQLKWTNPLEPKDSGRMVIHCDWRPTGEHYRWYKGLQNFGIVFIVAGAEGRNCWLWRHRHLTKEHAYWKRFGAIWYYISTSLFLYSTYIVMLLVHCSDRCHVGFHSKSYFGKTSGFVDKSIDGFRISSFLNG